MDRGKTNIGFVGLGAMGSVMAPLIARAGFNLITFDIIEKVKTEKNVVQAKNLDELVCCGIIILMLPDGITVREVALNLATKGFNGHLVDMSSCHPNDTIELGVILKEYDIQLIDAPVSGGVKKATSGSLMIMVGGSEIDFLFIKPLLNFLGLATHIGPLGAGHAMKALNNYVSASGLLASMQALATAEEYGINSKNFVAVINSSTGMNNSTQLKLEPFIIPRNYKSGFSLKLMTKDVEIASDIIRSENFSTPLSDYLPKYLKQALANLHENADHTALYEQVNPKRVDKE
jgi:3-hydroxyisobutyrate dehydrogenase